MLDLVHPNDLPTVLLIDDDLVSREVVATLLTMSGYPVHTAVDGESALKMIAGAECVPAVILMDAQMPGLSGTALIEQLRIATKATVIAISASAPLEEVVAAADGVLLKPFSPQDLTTLLEKRVAQARTGHEPPRAEPVVNPEILAQLREELRCLALLASARVVMMVSMHRRSLALEVLLNGRIVALRRREIARLQILRKLIEGLGNRTAALGR